MRGKKISSKDREAVIRAKLENPDLSSYDIEKKLGVKAKTAQDLLRKVPEIIQASSPDGELRRQVDQLNDIVAWLNRVIERSVKAYNENGAVYTPKDLKSVTDIAEINRKRSQVLQNKPTEKKEININDLSNKTPKELEAMRQSILGE